MSPNRGETQWRSPSRNAGSRAGVAPNSSTLRYGPSGLPSHTIAHPGAAHTRDDVRSPFRDVDGQPHLPADQRLNPEKAKAGHCPCKDGHALDGDHPRP